MPKEHRDYADSDLTGMTAGTDGGMGQILSAMEVALNGKKDKKAKKICDLHGKLLNKVKNELADMSEVCDNTRQGSLVAMKEKVKITKKSGSELSSIEGDLNDRYSEIEDCVKLLEQLAASRSSLQKKREQVELDHRQETMESYKKLKADIEDILNACMKGLTKVCFDETHFPLVYRTNQKKKI